MSNSEDLLRERIHKLEEELEKLKKQENKKSIEPEKNKDNNLSRRDFLRKAAGGVAGLGAVSMLPSAAGFSVKSPEDFSFSGNGNKDFNVDTDGSISASSIDLGQGKIDSFTGKGLSIDSNGALMASEGSNFLVSDNNTPIVDTPSDINFGSNLSVTDDGDSTVTIDASTSSSSGGGTGIIAAPGEVQSAIDSVASNSSWGDRYGTGGPALVRLQADKTCSPRSTWQIKPGVILDCQGALIRTNSNIDIMHVHPRAGVRDPYIDQRGQTNWNSTMIKLDTQHGRYWGPGLPLGIKNANLLSDAADNSHVTNQVGIHLHDSSSSVNGITGLHCSGNTRGMNETIKLTADSGSSAWCNGNDFHMNIWAPEVAVRHEAVSGGATNANRYVLQIQPHGPVSRWAWDLGTDAAYNQMHARSWEHQNWANGTIWRLASDCGGQNVYFDGFNGYARTGQVVNNSGDSSNRIVNWQSVGSSV